MGRGRRARARKNGVPGIESRTRPSAGRGRPPKFGRPSQVVALTLPQDVLDSLRTLHRDPGWAIVQLVESILGHGTEQRKSRAPSVMAELVHLSGRRALIVVQPRMFARLRGVSTIPLADGRAFLALDHQGGLADLEVAILDKLEATLPNSADRAQLMQIRKILRDWRHDRRFVFRTKSIIVVEGLADVDRRPLVRLRNTATADTGDLQGRRRK